MRGMCGVCMCGMCGVGCMCVVCVWCGCMRGMCDVCLCGMCPWCVSGVTCFKTCYSCQDMFNHRRRNWVVVVEGPPTLKLEGAGYTLIPSS